MSTEKPDLSSSLSERPWEELEELVEGRAEPAVVDAFLDTLPSGELARAVSRLSEADRTQLLTALTPDDAADLIEELSEAQAAELIEHLSPQSAAAILHELPSADQADLIGDLSAPCADAILKALSPDEAADVLRLANYADDVAGGLMITEFLSYDSQATVGDVIRDLHDNAERYRDYEVQYAYVVDGDGTLVGVLRLRDLLLAKRSVGLRSLMIPTPITLRDDTPLETLEDFFERHAFFAVPVVDDQQRLRGVLLRAEVATALRTREDETYRRAQGLIQEELRSMPLWQRSHRRLSWLSVNILLNLAAASIIAMHQDTLAQVIALAVFLPIISDMSGCSGNQAVAVSMRELTLGLVRPAEAFHVLKKELTVGLINGSVLGALVAGLAWVWKGNAALAAVVGVSLAFNTLVAVCVGGTVPLLLKRLGKDPALASGPILTTVTDMSGFLAALTLASLLLQWLPATQ